jgi:hypothetical protein
MTLTVLKDVLITSNRLDRYFEGVTPVNLWRAINQTRLSSPFEFIAEATVLSNGRPRPADIAIVDRDGQKWVLVKDRPRGVSTFDQSGFPAGVDWRYLLIPKGTRLPQGLALVQDEFNTKAQATHYTIAPAYDMPLRQFKILLDQLLQIILQKVA